ncbi:hypothetical protein [Litoreibacter janthinus]|uniref:YcxB-like protein n=1 Tax=Litoreibacter janthinus TaxID=670154 RepID=A0A1I6FWU6_9RHOB|nr:hypothetical protein [Litoreibacter janthinus]SFR34378.1 hypothetical protein SAMN04488002_0471 [Litoreibacter janthinus]
MTPVEFFFDWKDVNQAAASKALARNYTPKWWVTLALLLGGVALAVLVDRALFRSSGGGGLWGLLIGIYLCIGWNALRYRNMRDGISNSPVRKGGVTVAFDQDGFRVRTALTENWCDWSTITAIRPVNGLIVLAIGDVEYLPIIDSALPDGMTRQAMLTLLEQRTGITS